MYCSSWWLQILFLPLTPFRPGKLMACLINEKEQHPQMCVLLQKPARWQPSGDSLIVMGGRQQQFSYSGGRVSLLQVKGLTINFPNVMTLELSIYFPSYFWHTFSFAKEAVVSATSSSWHHINVVSNKAAVVDSYRKGKPGMVMRWDGKVCVCLFCRWKTDLQLLKTKDKANVWIAAISCQNDADLLINGLPLPQLLNVDLHD